MRSLLSDTFSRSIRLAVLLACMALCLAPQAQAQGLFDWFSDSAKSEADDSDGEEQTDLPFGPIDEKGRAVERSELEPVMAQDGSGLPYELWRGLTLTAFADAIGSLEIPPRSPALYSLWRRLITANVMPPAGAEGSTQFTALRAEALKMSGLLEDAERTLTSDASADTPLIALLAAEAQIGLGDRDKACETAKRFLVADAGLPKAMQGEAALVSGYCAAVHGDMATAGLKANLARELGGTGSTGADILDAVVADTKPVAPANSKVTLLEYRIAEIKGGFKSGFTLASAAPAMLARLAQDQTTPAELKLAAGEKAAQFNTIGPDQLEALYRDPNAGGDAGTIERASLFRSVADANAPPDKARFIRMFLDEAKRAGFYWTALRLMDGPALSIVPAAELEWFAETAIEVHLASGNYERARAWAQLGAPLEAGFGSPGASGALSHWLALIDLADPQMTDERSAHLAALEGMAERGQLDPVTLHRLATVLDALDISVPIPLWNAASRTPQPAGGHLPDTGILSELADASKKKEFGRTVVLAMRTIGPGGAEGAHIIALGDTIRALKRAGMESEARQLALEGVFSNWPRSAGH